MVRRVPVLRPVNVKSRLYISEWLWAVSYPENLEIGCNVDIGAFCYIQAKCGVKIGDNTQIGGGTKIYSVNSINGHSGAVNIGLGCRIGANSIVLPGANLPDNTFVPAMSIVTRKRILTPEFRTTHYNNHHRQP